MNQDQPSPSGRLPLAIGLALGVLAIGGAALFVSSSFSMEDFARGLQGAPTTGSIVDAIPRSDTPGAEPESPEVDMEPPLPYEGPRSAYLEAGLDLDVIDFGASSNAPPADPNAPQRLSRFQIQQTVNQHQRDLLQCYAAELQHDPDLSGSVEFDFAVHPSGRVVMVKISESSLQSYGAEDCFIEKARNWQFPAVQQDLPTRFQTSMAFQF